ncbi:MAG TPA: hemerythrin domain-containing protein [Streptosporangiaceae bacterium]|nr:hemerythrin domain-containing protein [Streptosporangiaceae bacterium]
MDITQLILDDHHEQRRLFAILEEISTSDTGTLGEVWARLAAFLEMHAAAEEAIFYPELLQVGKRAGRLSATEAETLDAIHDHNDIRDAIAAVPQDDVGSEGWFGAVETVNQVNGDHMAEEEREGLTDFRRETGLQLRHDLAVAWVGFEARNYAGVQPVDKDPLTYVRQAEGRDGATGSLGIGSLKSR